MCNSIMQKKNSVQQKRNWDNLHIQAFLKEILDYLPYLLYFNHFWRKGLYEELW